MQVYHRFYAGDAVILDNIIHILGGSETGYQTAHYKYENSEWAVEAGLPYSFYSGVVLQFIIMKYIY